MTRLISLNIVHIFQSNEMLQHEPDVLEGMYFNCIDYFVLSEFAKFQNESKY